MPSGEMKTVDILKSILRYSRPYMPALVGGLAGIILAQLLAVAIPQVLRFVVDRGIAQNDQDYMLTAGLFVVGLGILRGVAGFMGRFFTESLSHRVAYDVRNDFYDKVQRLSFTYHDTAHTGSLITRGISDVDEVQRFLAFGVLDGLNTVLVVTFACVVMFTINPLLAAIVLIPFIPLIFESRRFAEYVEREWRGIMEHIGNLSDHLQENVVGAEVVRAFAREDHEIKNFADENMTLYEHHVGLIRRWSAYIPFSAIMVAISVVLTLIVGGYFLQNDIGNLTVGVIVQFNAYILLMSQPVRFVGFIIMLANQGIGSARRVFEIMALEESIMNKPDAQSIGRIEGVIEFENVNFRYDDDLPYVLQDISFRAEPDDVVAIIGKTGAGKSTLVNMIPRFYDVTSGRVCIDGHDVRDVTLTSLHDQIGIVLQESLLFSATIRENIAFGKPDATEEEIIAAAKAADAYNFVQEFPEGFDTLVGERGVTVSGGQRQRIAIARALLIDPRILILDDATSSVDTQTEADIQAALGKLMKGRTTFIVAQRLTSVIHATQIIVLDEGRIVERGTHDQLMSMDGLYKEIYDLQMADQERVRRETIDLEGIDFAQLAGD